MYYDYLMIIAIIITLGAQILISVRYSKYKQISNIKKISGVEVAQLILKENGLEKIYVVETTNHLGDHYDSSAKVIRLSSEVFNGESIASAAIAAHEVGHAIQDKDGYALIKLRKFLVPFVSFSSKIGYIVIVLGLVLGLMKIFWLGVGLLSLILLFQLVTLPVEFNASARAKENLEKYDILSSNELEDASSVLFAAALTYVASLAATLLQILRIIFMTNGRD